MLPKVSIAAKVEMIETSRWSHDFAYREIEQFAALLEVQRFPAGDWIFREGTREACMGLLIQGRVIISKSNSSEGQKTIAVVHPGRTIGEMSLIDGEPRSASALADAPCTLLMLSKQHFELLVTRYPRVAYKLLLSAAKALSGRLRQTNGVLIELLD